MPPIGRRYLEAKHMDDKKPKRDEDGLPAVIGVDGGIVLVLPAKKPRSPKG